MGSVHQYQTSKGKRYLVRFAKPDNSQGAKKGFLTKRDANHWLAEIEASRGRGVYIDPQSSRTTVNDLGPAWLSAKKSSMKPSSYAPVETAWRIRVQPRWGKWMIGDIQYTHVRAWVTDLREEAGASVVIRTFGVLASILDDAVRDNLIARNPTRLGDVGLPKKMRGSHPYLTHDEVLRLAEASGKHRLLILVLAYTGIRWSEAAGLRVRDVDAGRSRFTIEVNAVEVHGTIHVGTPKSNRTREVPVPRFIMQGIVLATEGRGSDELVFPSADGTHMRRVRSSRGSKSWFATALKQSDLPPMRVHDLRHTAASLAVQSGAHVKTIQRMLGHTSAAMTLDVYSDLFDHDLDAVSRALEKAAKRAAAKSLPKSPPTGPFTPPADPAAPRLR